jgi:hypothetical protein
MAREELAIPRAAPDAAVTNFPAPAAGVTGDTQPAATFPSMTGQ